MHKVNKMKKRIITFEGQYAFLHRTYPCKINFEGKTYPSAEHCYQAQKTLDDSIRERIAKVDTPGQAKIIGQGIDLREGWDKIRLRIMFNITKQKFLQNPDLLVKLVDTENDELINTDFLCNQFWGVDERTFKGKNMLGRILEHLRVSLNRKDPKEVTYYNIIEGYKIAKSQDKKYIYLLIAPTEISDYRKKLRYDGHVFEYLPKDKMAWFVTSRIDEEELLSNKWTIEEI